MLIPIIVAISLALEKLISFQEPYPTNELRTPELYIHSQVQIQ